MMQCFEDRADPPLQKENANFCDFFAPAGGAFEAKTSTKSDAARNELDALFGANADDAGDDNLEEGESEEKALSKEEEARKKLDDLFG